MKLTPVQVKDKFGLMFSQRFLTMVDTSKGVAEIIETCAVRGTIEWDAVRREAAALYNDSALPLIKK